MAKQCLDTKTRITLGALGGISPIIISLLVVDIVQLFNETGLMDGIGLAIRFLVLIFIGGLVGYLHNKEEEPFKLFQLGIAAPALLTTAINGNSIANTTLMIEHSASSSDTPHYFFIKSAYAAETNYKNLSSFKQAKVSNTQLFLRGLIGTKLFSDEDDYLVIIGSHTNINKAKQQVKNVKKKKYRAKIYEPTDGSKYYAVVIGANLNEQEAKKLKAQAIRNGLPSDTYLWKKKYR